MNNTTNSNLSFNSQAAVAAGNMDHDDKKTVRASGNHPSWIGRTISLINSTISSIYSAKNKIFIALLLFSPAPGTFQSIPLGSRGLSTVFDKDSGKITPPMISSSIAWHNPSTDYSAMLHNPAVNFEPANIFTNNTPIEIPYPSLLTLRNGVTPPIQMATSFINVTRHGDSGKVTVNMTIEKRSQGDVVVFLSAPYRRNQDVTQKLIGPGQSENNLPTKEHITVEKDFSGFDSFGNWRLAIGDMIRRESKRGDSVSYPVARLLDWSIQFNHRDDDNDFSSSYELPPDV